MSENRQTLQRCLKDDKTSQWKGGNSQGCPQDVKSQDRDETETVNLQDRDDTETFQKTYRDRSVAV